VPSPAEPKFSGVVDCFVHSMNSCRLCGGDAGLTSSRKPAAVSWVIGVKSLTG
jgi:hypothetical protein